MTSPRPSASNRGPGRRYDRLSCADLTMLLTDRGQVPMNTGAVLLLDGDDGPTLPELRAVLAARVATVTRLRQRVYRPPPACGLRIWMDDTEFRLEEHVDCRELPGSIGSSGLLDLAAEMVCERLTPGRPPWRACIVTDPATGRVRALILVVRHVIADGLGGLAMLSALADPGLPTPFGGFPRPRPSYRALALDAAGQRVRGVGGLPARLRGALAGVRELGAGSGLPHRAGATSLTRPTSGRRRLSTVEIPLAEVTSAAHAADGTVNDVVLAAVGGALRRLLAQRGERPRSLVVSVPVSGRAAADPDHLGNRTGIRPVRIPLIADDRARLQTVAGITRAAAARRGPRRLDRSASPSGSSPGSACSPGSSTTNAWWTPSRPTCADLWSV